MHYHFVRDRVLSGEVELQYVPTDRQYADIFTKPLGLDKLWHFSSELWLRHLDTPNLRGRMDDQEEQEQERERSGGDHHGRRDHDAGSDEEFKFEPAEEAEEGSKGRAHREELKTTRFKGR